MPWDPYKLVLVIIRTFGLGTSHILHILILGPPYGPVSGVEPQELHATYTREETKGQKSNRIRRMAWRHHLSHLGSFPNLRLAC